MCETQIAVEDRPTLTTANDGEGGGGVVGDMAEDSESKSGEGGVGVVGEMAEDSACKSGDRAGDTRDAPPAVNACFDNDPAEMGKIKKLTPELINLILKTGPSQPTENEMVNSEFPKDSEGRKFHSAWYWKKLNDGTVAKREWLSYSVSTNRIFCTDCMLFGKSPAISWVSSGFKSWSTGTFGILAHETSEKHVQATLARKIHESSLPVLPALKGIKAEQVAKNRLVVKHLVDITLFLARRCLAFRGHRESVQNELRGNFKDLAALLGEYSPIMASYLTSLSTKKKNKLSFLSWRRQNQLIDVISAFIRQTFCKKIKDAKMFSISVDSSFDKSRKEQTSLIVRYVDEETAEIHERLLAVRESPCTTGRALSELFQDVCKNNGLDWESDLVGQSHDGASNMRGEYEGLQALIREINPRATYVWCWAHRLNLIIVSAVGSSVDAVDLFGNLEKLFAFINKSKVRVHMFSENQTKGNLRKAKEKGQLRRLKRVSTTRWMSHYYALQVVLETFEELMETLEQIRTVEGPSDYQAGAMAGGFISYFCSQRFCFTATAFVKIFEIVDPFTKSLQSPDIDLLSAAVLLENTLSQITALRNQFDGVMSSAQMFMDATDIEFEPLPTTRSRKRKKMPGEMSSDETIVDPADSFRVKTFYVMVDTVTTQLHKRFKGDSDVTLELIKDLSLLSRKRLIEVCENPKCLPQDAFNSFCSIYSKYSDANEVRKEFVTFSSCFKELEKTIEIPSSLHADAATNSSEVEQGMDLDSELESDCENEVEGIDLAEESASKVCSNVGSLPQIFKLFCKAKLKTVFPNLHAVLKIAVTLSLTSVSTERSFSKLNRVKTDLRSTMGDERLEGLLTIACENDIPIDVEKIIDLFASRSSVLMENLMF